MTGAALTRPAARRRFVTPALVQLAAALLCLLFVAAPPPDPPARYAVTEGFVTGPDGGQAPVSLPARFSAGAAPHVEEISATFRRDAGADGEWSVMLPRFINAAQALVNGVVVLDTRRDVRNSRAGRNLPDIAVIPETLLRPGINQLTVRLYVWGPVSGYLDRPFVGPDSALRPAYEARIALFDTMPLVLSSWQMALALVLGIMWLKRRQEKTYGLVALALAIGAAHIFQLPPEPDSWLPGLRAALVGTAPLEVGLLLMFAILFTGGRLTPLATTVALAPGAAVFVAGVMAGPHAARLVFLVVGMPAVAAFLAVIWRWASQAALAAPTPMNVLFSGAATVLCVCFMWDIATLAGLNGGGSIFVSRIAWALTLAVTGACLTWRFASALNEVDSFAVRLVGQVREAEEKLRASFALEEQRKRAAALAADRARLTRDLHDGLGGQLVSIVALAERSDVNGALIGEAARSALRDLRLVIDALDEIDGDLMLALGAWRERTAARLSPHNIRLEWRALSPGGLPVHEELRPWHVIQLLRLMDEAVTNTVKHAGASCITVSFGATEGGDGVRRGRIIIADDGHGFAAANAADADGRAAGGQGRGLANMRRRAERCGARVAVESDADGTRVIIDLPERFPESDGG
ncbi:sensor histidine kinase [Camelimonas abortus]|uniref:Sensor histidine kinase n=1 Tax=Camelimonas abortus TaxID=1017184 RepID=A0ABV7LAM2_9HYPH